MTGGSVATDPAGVKEFTFSSPATVAEAVALLGQGAQPLAGGTDLIVQMREGRRAVGHVVDLKRIPALNAIEAAPDGSLRIGAALSVTKMAAHPALSRYPALVESGRMIGSWQIQNRASIGGNLCNAAPSADAIPALIVLGARAVIAGPNGIREAPVESLFERPGRTKLGNGELLQAIVLPEPPEHSAAKYLRFTPRREMDIAVAGAGAWLRLDAQGAIAEARVALASVAPTPIRAPKAEQRLTGEKPSAALFDEAGRLAAQDARPISDTRGSAQYRQELVRVLTRRALAGCCAQLGVKVEVA
ncbi:MAG: xanthine dehydrogenase family protein subunit M [Alphaproteobacteria bacterium]|nr:xanthine dehydrogenase family protein subunit M [Alphaproteobacteria bacterium]